MEQEANSLHVINMRDELKTIASAANDAPWGLPGKFYTDHAYFAHECATTLHNGWHCVGRADEIAEPGDFFTVTLLGEPLIIVRNETGIKALSNVCQHRGMQLVTGKGHTKRFTCPYHAWMYGTDGSLLRASRMRNAAFDAKSCKLGEFACAEKFGFIYICLSDNPPDLDVELSGLDEQIGPYQPGKYRIVHQAVERWNTNWKCLVENFMEGYHLSVVHPQTLHGYTPTALSKKGVSGPGHTSYHANYPHDIESRGKGSPDLSDEQRHRSFLFAVFPCQVVSIAATLLVSLSLRPVAADCVEVKWTMSAFEDELDEETIRQRIALWEDVNREDREKLEAMQTCLGSKFAKGGPLAEPDYEGTVHDVIMWLAKQNSHRPDGHVE